MFAVVQNRYCSGWFGRTDTRRSRYEHVFVFHEIHNPTTQRLISNTRIRSWTIFRLPSNNKPIIGATEFSTRLRIVRHVSYFGMSLGFSKTRQVENRARTSRRKEKRTKPMDARRFQQTEWKIRDSHNPTKDVDCGQESNLGRSARRPDEKETGRHARRERSHSSTNHHRNSNGPAQTTRINPTIPTAQGDIAKTTPGTWSLDVVQTL